jgi:hypothetical protein
MKSATLLLVALMATSVIGQSTSEVRDLTALRSSWSKAREQAVMPLDQKYDAALRALKDRLTKAGNLDGAIQVDAELKNLATASQSAANPAQPLFGRWEIPGGKGIVTIREDGTAENQAGSKVYPGKWSIKSGFMVIEWASKVSTRISLRQKAGELSVTSTDNGKREDMVWPSAPLTR